MGKSLRLATKKEREDYLGIKSIKQTKKEEKMPEIKEYKVITVFPTATKDYQIGEIIKKGTALFKKAHKFPKFFEAVEIEKPKKLAIGDIIVIESEPRYWNSAFSNKSIKNEKFPFIGKVEKLNKKDDSSLIEGCGCAISYLKWRPATPAEIKQYNFPKVGDVVVQRKPGYFSFIPNVTEVTKITDGDHIWVKETDGGNSWTIEAEHHKYYRKATEEETAEYKKSKEKCVTVSNNSISLEIKKDGVITCGKGRFKIEEVKKLYLAVNALVGINIGSWNSTIADDNARFIRIGCKDENFLVSRNDLKNVISTFESIK